MIRDLLVPCVEVRVCLARLKGRGVLPITMPWGALKGREAKDQGFGLWGLLSCGHT